MKVILKRIGKTIMLLLLLLVLAGAAIWGYTAYEYHKLKSAVPPPIVQTHLRLSDALNALSPEQKKNDRASLPPDIQRILQYEDAYSQWYVPAPWARSASGEEDLRSLLGDTEDSPARKKFTAELEALPEKPGSEWTDAEWNALSAFVRDHAASFEAFWPLLSGEGPLTALNLNSVSFAPIEHFTYLRDAAEYACRCAQNCAHCGDSSGAFLNIERAFLCAQVLAHEPLMMAYLVQSSCAGIAMEGLMEVFPPGSLQPAQEERLVALAEACTRRIQIADVLAGEQTFVVNQPAIDPETKGLWRIWDFVLAYSPVESINTLLFLRSMARYREQAQHPHYETIDEPAIPPGHAWGLWCSYLQPSLKEYISRFGTVSKSQAHRETWTGLMKIGLAIEREYQVLGKYPDSLEELTPRFPGGLPKDPFSGKPYRYTPSKGGFLLYSVGPNLVDDGGKSDSVSKGDLVWRKPLLPLRNPRGSRKGTPRPHS